MLEDTKNITLHAKHLNISSDDIVIRRLKGDNETVSVNRIEFSDEFDFFIIHTNEVIQKDSYDVFIPFRSDLSKGLLGFYRSSYVDKQSNEKR